LFFFRLKSITGWAKIVKKALPKKMYFCQKQETMIKVGDKVKFLNDVGGGRVTGFISKNMVNVENEDGFEIPYPISELVNVEAPEFNPGAKIPPPRSEENKLESKREIEILTPEGEIINGKNSPDFYFCLVPGNPKNPVSGEIELFLLNDSNFTLLYRYFQVKSEKIETVKSGLLQSNSRIIVERLTESDFSDLPEFGFQILYFRNSENEINEPVTKKFKINPVKFYKESSFTPNSYFQRNAMILQISKNILTTEIDKLTEEDFRTVVKEKEKAAAPVKTERKQTQDEIVVDLHISELLDKWDGLSNRELLEIQMEKVETEMKAAIQSMAKRIVFIHGVGQGVLKQEVANLLQRKFKKYYFQDASFKEYGYGATMVILRR
jgi:hypothetical protein